MANPSKKLKSCRGRELLKDRFSELPDEILVNVVSLLTMKEAGRTSVLSKSWRYVWAYIPLLNFDASKSLDRMNITDESEDEPRYLRWANQVVGSYKGPSIDEFRLRFDLGFGRGYRNSMDSLVNFAMEKKVKKFELNCFPFLGKLKIRCYTFPGLSISSLLTSLQLAYVDVTDQVLQKFLNGCPNLEYLSVEFSQLLENMEVAGALLHLKHLKIRSQKLKHFDIYAPNLVSFEYDGPIINFPFKSTPKLAKLSIGGDYGQYLTNNFLELSNYLCQLEELKLDSNKNETKHVTTSVAQFPICTRLKQLELIVNPSYEDLLFLASLIKACPFLNKFVLKLHWKKPVSKREWLRVEAFRHEFLKVIEIQGFIGQEIDVEFIMYLMESCVALEKIVIDCCDPELLGSMREFKDKGVEIRAREQAGKLRAKLEPGFDLIII